MSRTMIPDDATLPDGRSRLNKGWLFLVAAIVTEVIGTLSLKAALENPVFYVLVVGGYVAAFASLAQVLRAGLSIGVAYGIWGACGVALTALLSYVVFSEPLTPMMVTGIVVIIAGVLCIELGGRKVDAQ